MEQIELRLAALIANLAPQNRAKMLRKIAQDLRKSAFTNTKAQKNPDGTSFEPRKNPNLAKKGKLRQKMFLKIANAKNLKARATANQATVSFSAATNRIAQIHHFGLEGQVRAGLRHKYAARRLIGISTQNEKDIENVVIAALSAH